MTDLNLQPNQKLDACLTLALSRDRSAISNFFIEFIKGPIFAVERYQTSRLSNAPEYPNDFVNILGIKSKERVIVPAFTRPELIPAWSGETLLYKAMSGEQLLKLIPDQWWICVNPGQEAEKEISPWEVDLLRGGTGNIPAIVQEIFSEDVVRSLSSEPVPSEECLKLKKIILEKAQATYSIKKIYMMRERGVDAAGEKATTLLLGLEVATLDRQSMERISGEFQAAANLCQIGDEPVRVLIGQSKDEGLVLGVFKGSQPIYEAGKLRRFAHALKAFNFCR